MDIHFCDLCNESVPQSDLDTGHAFIRRGRVVCARCERAMTHGEGSASHESPATRVRALESESTATVETRTESGADRIVRARSLMAEGASEPWPASTEAASPGGSLGASPAAAVAPAAPAPARSAGLVMAVVAILFAAGAVAVLNEEIGGLADRAKVLEAQRREQEAAQRELERADATARESIAGLEARFTAALETERQAAEKSLAALRAENERVKSSAAELVQKLEEVRTSSHTRNQELDKREDEITHRLAKSEDDGRALVERMAKIEEHAQRPAPAAAAPVPAAEAAWSALVVDLSSPKAATRWEAVDQIGQAADPEAVPYLVPMLKDADVFVRMATARVLGDLKVTTSVPALIDALEDAEPAVREAALGSLRSLTGKDLRFDPMAGEADRAKKVKAWRDWWKKAEEEGGAGRGQG